MNKKVVCLGEMMLRLSPQSYNTIEGANMFNACFGGAEANVAVSLANFGIDASFVTLLPDNSLGRSAIRSLKEAGVNTNFIKFKDDRMGIYFVEKGIGIRNTKVIYDRLDSSITKIKLDDFDLDEIFKEKNWFHITGITPALSLSCAEVTKEALKVAKEKGLTISFDLNYRKKIWSLESALNTCRELLPYVDIFIGSIEDAINLLGYQPKKYDKNIKANSTTYKMIFEQMKNKFGISLMVTTLRESSSSSANKWSAVIYNEVDFYESKHYDISIVDRIGTGDAFGAGVIYGLLQKKSLQDTIEFATAASALKHTIEGDFNWARIEDVEALTKSENSGRVER